MTRTTEGMSDYAKVLQKMRSLEGEYWLHYSERWEQLLNWVRSRQ